MNTAHMTEEDWAMYIQVFKPEPDQVDEFINDLYQYAKRGNVESGISKFRIDGLVNKYPHIRNTKEYRQIQLIDKSNQLGIQDGFWG